MEKKKLISTIRSLQSLRVGGEPNPVWLRSTRERLLSEIRAESAVSTAREHSLRERFAIARILLPHRLFRYVAKPVMVSSITLGMALGGWITTVSASYGTLPGDALYGVKLATERAQFTFAQGPEAKTRLKVEFVGRRVDEVAKIVENPGADKAKRVSKAVKQLKQDISTVKSDLNELQSSKPNVAVEVAKLVDRKTEEFHAALAESVEAVPEEVKQEVQEAQGLVVDASVNAVAVIVETHNQGTGSVSEQDAKDAVGDKITTLSGIVSSAVESALTAPATSASSTSAVVTDKAIKTLGEAKTLLDHNDIDGALSKVIEGTELAKVAETLVVTAPGVATSTAPASLPPVESATSTTSISLPATSGSSTPR